MLLVVLLVQIGAATVVGMLSGRMLERWCPDDDVLAKRHLVETLGEDPALFEGRRQFTQFFQDGILPRAFIRGHEIFLPLG